MSYTRSTLNAAKQEAEQLNKRDQGRFEYHVERYPYGDDDVANWPWGITQWEPNYFPGGSAKCHGYVWQD